MDRACRLACLAVVGLVLAQAVPAPAAAVGPVMQLYVSPPNGTGEPGPGQGGPVNFSGFVEVFSNPIGSATVAIAIESNMGWTVSPASFSWRVTAPERFEFEFVVTVPEDAVADSTDTVAVTASYRLGGVTTGTETATVYVNAAPYYAAALARITPPLVMEPGRSYIVEYDLRNTGNAPASFTFAWLDGALMDKVRGELLLPAGATLAGFTNDTVQISVKPGGTTPGGKFALPARAELRNRPGQVMAVVNFTVDLEFANLPIYQGWLPNWDLNQPAAFGGWVLIVLGAWFGLHVLVALLGAGFRTPGVGGRFWHRLRRHLDRSLLVRGGRGLLAKARRGARRAPRRPDEVAGRAAAAGRARR